MIFNKTFQISTIMLLLTTVAYTMEASDDTQKFTPPSLEELCIKAAVQKMKTCKNVSEYLEHANVMGLDHDQFIKLMTTTSDDNYTIFHHAVLKDKADVETLLDLCEQKLDSIGNIPHPSAQDFVDIKDPVLSISPVARAIAHKRFDIADLLRQRGASLTSKRIARDSTLPELTDSFYLISPLIIAIRQGNIEGIKYLTDHKVSLQDSNLAVGRYVPVENRAQIAELEQERWTAVPSEDQDWPNKENMVLLIHSEKFNALETFIELPPLHLPFDKTSEILWSLIGLAKTAEETNDLMHQSFVDSVDFDNYDALKALLIKAPNHIIKNHPKVLNKILKSRRDNIDPMITLLMESGAAVNDTDNDGNTPLHLAVQRQNPYIIRKLVDHGANINSINPNGATPLDFNSDAPRTHERTEIRRYLTRKGALVGRRVQRTGINQ